MHLTNLLTHLGWKVVYSETRPGRDARYATPPSWLPEPVQGVLKERFPQGLYQHQVHALEAFHQGRHVAMTTATASGKSLVFYLAALSILHREPEARIAALYPLKAPSKEQEQRWRAWMQEMGWPTTWVQRIDGDVPRKMREDILRQARVILFTPDVIHAWLLPSVDTEAVVDFLRSLRFIVVDEVHTYTGVFGSNAAFLFRRWRHLMHLAGNPGSQWLASSATLRDARQHLQKLFGLDFQVVDEGQDGSPQHLLEILMVEPPEGDRFTALGRLFHALVTQTPHRFLAFAESRKQVEFLGALVRRFESREPGENPSTEGERDRVREVLEKAKILPYQAGLEYEDREAIQDRLSEGDLRGVISTSALELGMDIGHLDVAVLIGVPPTMTSFQQRIGRVGRQGPGYVLVVNTGDPQDSVLFQDPQKALRRPLAESTLYLENPYLQYIHVMCLARLEEGEHDRLLRSLGREVPDESFASPVEWPAGFLPLCEEERTGQVSRELRNWAVSAQNQMPQLIYPLRDIEPQFQVEERRAGHVYRRGSLSFYQVLNEAYPGAVYYYAGVPYRVVRVSPRSRRIEVRSERYYRTHPRKYPWMVPSLRPESIRRAYAWGPLVILETELMIRERISGYQETRGNQKIDVQYPNDYWEFQHFERSYFSTGIVFTHPALNEVSGISDLAEQLFEAFLLVTPVDRQEVSSATGRMPVGHEPFFPKGQRFIALYERIYGGLHLTGRLLDDFPQTLQEVLEATRRFEPLAEVFGDGWFRQWATLVRTREPQRLYLDPMLDTSAEFGQRVRIIMPGSRGYVVRDGQHLNVLIHDVRYLPKGLFYFGVWCDMYLREGPDAQIEMPFAHTEVHPIPGKSCMGWFDLDTGNKIPDEERDCVANDDCWSHEEFLD